MRDKKFNIIALACLILISGLSSQAYAQTSIAISHKRHVIPSYVEPNTPGAPGVTVDPKINAAITDPAARRTDGSLNLNQAVYVRFFAEGSRATPEAIVVLIPEKSAGAGSLRIVAKNIVATSGGRFEVWVVDHRASLMEDIGAMVKAENDKTLASSFEALRAYQNHPSGSGGVLANSPAQLSGFMSEWGLDVFLRDVRSIVNAARAVTGNVYLGGHAQGADLTQMFASYNFGDIDGYRLIRGMILLDGTASPATATPISDASYLNGGEGVVGLNQLRTASVEPFAVAANGKCSASLFQVVQVSSQIALLDPEGTTLQRFLPSLVPFPATNAAFMALILDDEFQREPVARVSLGFLKIPTGGTAADVATRTGNDPAGVNPNGLWTPKDPGTGGILRWESYRNLRAVDPSFSSGAEVSTLEAVMQQSLLISTAEGKTATSDDANSNHWFFPVRLTTDMRKFSDLGSAPLSEEVVAAQTARGGNAITMTESAEVNVPLVAIRGSESGLVTSIAKFKGYRKTTRIKKASFTAKTLNGYTNADMVVSLEKTSASGKNAPMMIVEFINGNLGTAP